MSLKVVVGGLALQRLGLRREPRDKDIWTESDNHFVSYEGEEVSLIPQTILESFSPESLGSGFANAEDLLAIKLSHLPYDIKWSKHLNDMLLLKNLTKGEYNVKLYKNLCKYWSKIHTKEHLSLYKTKDEFFDDFVVKEFEHDWLHILVAVEGTPIYTKVLSEGQEVLVCKEKFDKLWYNYKVQMWREEIAVIALERWVIPSEGKISYLVAWHRSLHKVVTALTKGWASEWIIFNIEEFLTPLELPELVWRTLFIKENKMDLNELSDVLNKLIGDDVFGDYDSEDCVMYLSDFLVDGGLGFYENPHKKYGVEFIEQEGGGEGGGEYCYTVFKIKDTLYKVEYSYYSHEGFNFDYMDFKEVKPVQRMVTFYE